MSKSLLDHLIEETGRIHCASNGDGWLHTSWDTTFAEARRIVTEFAGPPCEEFEPGEAIGVCEICRWPSREHGRAK